ncbi:thiamine pyrophosphate-dependent enzyme [Winogradskya humida]|uniref:3D-(3,5/4)-trihydroxycyclohexane-1,2-dione hydrolase n=1 Tax=Winogradskya humida TaxID=113566 RepID=A0ABQ3ZZD4_9ACTN|nr:thiamine pyrophosphate-dependent enzyme [Actinoplanes humidus]GIE23961.1 hypothetical protein Ahu01nite_070630 [Actinoplanes humidus]
MRLTVAQAVVRFLAGQWTERDGVEQRAIAGAWGIFGHGNVAGIGQALLQAQRTGSADLPYRLARNEQAMVHAAAGFAKMKNRLSTYACTASIGPGSTNMLTGAALATVNRLPVLLLPSDVFATRAAAPVLQELEDPRTYDVTVNDAFRPLSRFFDRIWRPEQLPSALLAAMRVLFDPAETGAVTISLPQDVQAEAWDFPDELFARRVWHIARPAPEQAAVIRAADAIRSARRPLIIAGGGVIYSEASAELDAFARATGIPVADTHAGKGALSWDHPQSVGGIGSTGTPVANHLARDADVIIGIGTRYSDFTTASRTAFANPGVHFVNLNVTSFDAHKQSATAVVADARSGLTALTAELSDIAINNDTATGVVSQREVVASPEEIASGQQTGVSGQQTAVSGEQTAVSGEQTAVSGRRTMAGQENVVPGPREVSIGPREVSTGQREVSTGQREVSTGQREVSRGQREVARDQRELVSGRHESVPEHGEGAAGLREVVSGQREAVSEQGEAAPGQWRAAAWRQGMAAAGRDAVSEQGEVMPSPREALPGQRDGVGGERGLPGQRDGVGGERGLPGQRDGAGRGWEVPARSEGISGEGEVPGRSEGAGGEGGVASTRREEVAGEGEAASGRRGGALWQREVGVWQAEVVAWQRVVDVAYHLNHGPLPAQSEVIGAVNDACGERDVVVQAAGSMPGDLQLLWRARDPKQYHVEYGYSCMGFEIAGAVGIKLADPTREVYALVGDGSYLMMAQEIVTAIAEGLKLVIVLVQNHGFASIGALSESLGSQRFGTSYRYRGADDDYDGGYLPVDLAANAESLGAAVVRCRTIADLTEGLKRARDADRLTVVYIETDAHSPIPSSESWWDVPVSAVSELGSTREARAGYEAAKRGQRQYLREGPAHVHH